MITRRAQRLVLGFLLVSLAAFSPLTAAQGLPPLPQLTAPVNDFANVIDAGSERELDRRIRALKAASGDVVVVATVKTYQPYADINEYAVKMFENGGRGIGDKGKDNGLLIVVAVDDRKIKIEVGYDLEQFITDGFAGETIRDVITPQFRSGNFGAGLLAGVTTIVNRIAQGRGVTLQNVPCASGPAPHHRFRLPLVDHHRHHHYRDPEQPLGAACGGRGDAVRGVAGTAGSDPLAAAAASAVVFGGFGGGGGGGGGGGFGGFGGGSSGGGGASGGW